MGRTVYLPIHERLILMVNVGIKKHHTFGCYWFIKSELFFNSHQGMFAYTNLHS